MEAKTRTPTLSLETEHDNHPWANLEDRDLYIEGLRKAGLSESF